MPKADVVMIGSVHVIEWLEEGDLRIGWNLYNELEPIGITYRPPITAQFHRVTSPVEFMTALAIIASEAIGSNRVPLLHIDSHGSEFGIGPGGDNSIQWEAFRKELVRLNHTTRLNLVVIFSACEAAWAIKLQVPADRAAFFGTVGPNKRPAAGALLRAYLAFYKEMFATRSFDRAFAAMKKAVLPERRVFSMTTATLAFETVWADLRDKAQAQSHDFIEARLDAIEASGAADGLTEAQRLAGREAAREAMLAHDPLLSEDNFQASRRQFFFIDRLPENDDRFPLTLPGCRTAEELMSDD